MVFDRKITLLKREELPNLMGEVEVSYSVITPTHAEKVWKRGGEQQSANQQVRTTVESFRIRYRTGLTQVNAIEYNGELWDVRSIQEEERNKYLVLECERKDSQTDIATVVNGLILTEDGLYYLVTEDETYYLQQETA